MSTYLAEELARLGVDDEAIIEYCSGLLEDETMSADEKQEAIVGYLEAVVPDQDAGPLVCKAIEAFEQQRQLKAQESQKSAHAKLAQALEKEKEELQRDSQIPGATANKPIRQLTTEERRRRELLLAAYDNNGVELVERADGETEMVIREQSASVDMSGLSRNDNAKLVADKERMARETSRAAHQKKVEREKELLEIDRLRKEKEKRRTMKKEKRRM